MRFFLPLEPRPTGANSLQITQVSGNYYGPLYFWITKSASGSGATAKAYAGEGARDFAIAHDANQFAGHLTIPNAAPAWVTIINDTPGPKLGSTKIYCNSTGTFTSALYAYSDELEYELVNRMKLTLQNYCAVDEQLRDVGFLPNGIQVGLTQDDIARDRQIGVALADSRDMPRAAMGTVEARPRFVWTVWIKDHKNKEATARMAYRVIGRLRRIAYDEQREWGGLCRTTEGIGTLAAPVPWITALDGSPTRYGLKVRLIMECHADGHEHEDYTTTTPGGRYAAVDLSES